MCGLVAVISKKQYGFIAKDVEVFMQLLLVDVVRGDDATGVIIADRDGDFTIAKEATPSYEFIPAFSKLPIAKQVAQTGTALIGHNRKGTMGGMGDAAAHPFVVKDRFAMVHNGTLYGHQQLAKTDVDSEALAIVIEEAMNSEDYSTASLEDVLSKVYGAYAVIWYNQVTNQVQFVRNHERTLYIGETDDTWILASEGAMIQWMCLRHGIKLKNIEAVKEGVLHTLDLDEKDVPLYKEELSLKKATPPVVITTHTAATKVGAVSIANITYSSKFISKNEFKRLKKRIHNKEIEFYVADYLEAGPRGKFDEDYDIIGCCDDIGDDNHLIHGRINVTKHGIYAIEYADSFLFVGKVVDMEYNMKTKQAEIWVEGIKTLPSSYSNLPKGKSNEKAPTALH